MVAVVLAFLTHTTVLQSSLAKLWNSFVHRSSNSVMSSLFGTLVISLSSNFSNCEAALRASCFRPVDAVTTSYRGMMKSYRWSCCRLAKKFYGHRDIVTQYI